MLAMLFSLSLWFVQPAVLPMDNSIQWLTETEFDFGDIKPGVPVQHTYTFKNTTQQPIIIETVRTSCGCTGSTWTETPVLPDSIGIVKIEFDAKQSGEFRKYAKVYFANLRSAQKLWVSGFVVEQ